MNRNDIGRLVRVVVGSGHPPTNLLFGHMGVIIDLDMHLFGMQIVGLLIMGRVAYFFESTVEMLP